MFGFHLKCKTYVGRKTCFFNFFKSVVVGLENIYKQAMNPNVTSFGSVVNGVQRLRNGSLEAASDWRKEGGGPSGY